MDIFCGWDIVVFRLDILSAGIYHLDLIICESNFFISFYTKRNGKGILSLLLSLKCAKRGKGGGGFALVFLVFFLKIGGGE
jgi:hypothetical protein